MEPEPPEPDAGSIDGLLGLIGRQRDLIIAVGTGGPGIKTVDDQYQDRRRRIAAGLARLGLPEPFPWRSLWDWYGFYSANLATYQERREHIRELADTVLQELERRQTQATVADWGQSQEPTWDSLEARLTGLKTELDAAASQDDLQDVGRRARETIIDAANLVFEDSMVPAGQDVPPAGDAKNRIGYYIAARMTGPAHAELRSVVKKTLELAHKVTHSSGITRVDAFAAAQATVLVVRTLQEIQRD
ncbi:MAG: hypothetical protein WEB06_09010 [Actinomycetota bacterium]